MVSRRSPSGGLRRGDADDDLQRRSTVRPDGPGSKQAPMVTGAARWMRQGGRCAWTGLLSLQVVRRRPVGGATWPSSGQKPHCTAVELRHLAGRQAASLREPVCRRYVLVSPPALSWPGVPGVLRPMRCATYTGTDPAIPKPYNYRCGDGSGQTIMWWTPSSRSRECPIS
jgi:hypothetical protein